MYVFKELLNNVTNKLPWSKDIFEDISWERSESEYFFIKEPLFKNQKVSSYEKGLLINDVTANHLLLLSKIIDHAK